MPPRHRVPQPQSASRTCPYLACTVPCLALTASPRPGQQPDDHVLHGQSASLRRGAKSSRPHPVQRPGFPELFGPGSAVPRRARGPGAVGLACATRSLRRCPNRPGTGGRLQAARGRRHGGPGAWRVPTSGAGVDRRVSRGEGDMMARAACSGLVSLAALDSLLGGRERHSGTSLPSTAPPPRVLKKNRNVL